MNRKKYIFNFIATFVASMMCFAAYAENPCPAVSSIQYDKTIGQFISKEGPGWRSADMAALNPSPLGVLKSIIATGERADAAIICTYDLGKNSVTLNANRHYKLGAGWASIKDNFYYCADIKTCVSKLK
jgi:hypothetical protein